MKIISLGGVGGCVLAQALRDLKQPAYPYDWLITTQSFIINSLNNFNNFFDFNNNYIYDKTKLLVHDKKAIMLHDFYDFDLQKEEVIAKYKRRFDRLNNCLQSKEDILFVRIYDNLKEVLIPINYYDDLLIREEENIEKWDQFIQSVKEKYNKKIKLLIITSTEDICGKEYNNIILYFTKKHQNSRNIYNIIENIEKSCNK